MKMLIFTGAFICLSGLATASVAVQDPRPQAPGEDITAPDDTVRADCTFDSVPLHGKVEVVDAFPDIKVQIVDAFPDLRVKWVTAFPDDCGEWQEVDAFPDFTIQYVDAFPDIEVQIVESFPGMGRGG